MTGAPAPDPRRRTRGRRLLISLIGLFFVPLFAAWLWFANVDLLRPQSGSNHGELIVPAQPLGELQLATPEGQILDAGALSGSWTLVHVAGARCSERCAHNLYNTRQVRIALGRDLPRVKRLLLTAPGAALDRQALAEQHPDLLVAVSPALVDEIEQATLAMAVREDAVYLIDPLRNLMMRFPADLDPRLVLEDLKHLLKISHIG